MKAKKHKRRAITQGEKLTRRYFTPKQIETAIARITSRARRSKP